MKIRINIYVLTTLFITFFCFVQIALSQKILLLTSSIKTSIRGLSVVDEKTIWASGSNGMIARSTNGGNTFSWTQVPNFEKKDFRDIEAFDSSTAIVIAIAEPAYILKTNDGGKTWKIVFKDSTKGMFLDAMDFVNDKNGVVIGDPINNKTFIATTTDGGGNWIKQDAPILAEGEAFFASSGSNILMLNKKKKNNLIFVSGGKKSTLYFNNEKFELPIKQGFESTGANAIAVYKNKAIIVGGDFSEDSIATNNCVLVDLKTMQFSRPKTNPTGYRSSVTFINKKTVITCGLNGVDISNDAGLNWQKISNEDFNVVKKSNNGKAIFLAGSKGRIAKLNVE